MKTDSFFEAITKEKDFFNAEKKICEFVNKTFKKETDTLWEKGAQRMLVGSMLFLLKKGELTKSAINNFFMLNTLEENRRKVLYKMLKKAPQEIQTYFVGIVDSADTTFKGFVGILKNYVEMF